MDELVFSVFVTELKNAFKEPCANEDMIQLLYDGVSNPAGVEVYVHKSAASKVMNRKSNVSKIIRRHSNDDQVLDSITTYFKVNIEPRILDSRRNDLINNLNTIIDSDGNISTETKSKLVYSYSKDLNIFLSNIFIYTLAKDNKEEVLENSDPINIHANTNNILEDINAPEEISGDENKYVQALYDVYGEKKKLQDFKHSDLSKYPDLEIHFKRQRHDYFNADFLKRQVQDVFNGSEYFDEIKGEIYNGIIDTYEDDYDDGMACLRAVLVQASNTTTEGSRLTSETKWVSVPRKKGICHMLVNEGKLDGWVK